MGLMRSESEALTYEVNALRKEEATQEPSSLPCEDIISIITYQGVEPYQELNWLVL